MTATPGVTTARPELTRALLVTAERCLAELNVRYGATGGMPADEAAEAVDRLCDAFDAFATIVRAPLP